MADDEKSSKNQILQALVALRHTLYQASPAARCTTSLTLPRSADANDDAASASADAVPTEAPRPLSRHLSLPLVPPFRLTPTPNQDDKHIGIQRVGCLFSLEVVAARGLPPSMNGTLLAVAVRRKEIHDGAQLTMPARVQNGAADFDETLYVRCHVYSSGGGGTGKPLKFEPRPFLLSVIAVDAPELDLGQSTVDFSAVVKEFTEKCQQGECPRQWDATFPLAAKARGGDLVVKLAFQIVEGLGLVVDSQPDAAENATNSSSSSWFARKVSKSSFIITSPKMLRSQLSFTRKMDMATPDLKDTDNLKLDEPAPTAEVKAAVPAEQKEQAHKRVEVKVDQLRETAEPEPAVIKEEEQMEPKHDLESEEAKEEEEQKELEPEPEVVKEEEQQKEPEDEPESKEAKEEGQKESEPEDEKSAGSELPEFDVVDKGIEEQEYAEAEKTSQETVLGAVSDADTESVEQPEAKGEEVTRESHQPLEANEKEMTRESQQPPEANREEVTEQQLPEAKEQHVTGESLQAPEQREVKAPAAKSPPRRIRWRTLAVIVAPVAIMIGKALAGRMRGKH